MKDEETAIEYCILQYDMTRDESVEIIDQSSIPQLVLILAEYQYKAAFVADKEINLMAAFTEIMTGVKFK
jgi:hypothetical protein